MGFEWPWQYSFPPFFTLQPNVDTRQKQLAAWCSLVLSYCRHNKLYNMTVLEAQESPLFNNKKIQRKLSMESIQVVLENSGKKLRENEAPINFLILFNERMLQRNIFAVLKALEYALPWIRNLEWLDKTKTSFLIMWRRPEEWGKLIYQWVSKNGMANSVFTFYELTCGDDTEKEEFHGLDESMLLRSLQHLQLEHKAEVIMLNDSKGVKFF